MQFDKILETYSNEIIEKLRNTIAIKSAYIEDESPFPYGKDVHDCLEYVLNLAREMGFKTCDVDGYVGWCEHGTGEEMIAVVTHLDTVPVGDGWTVAPYAGEIKDGKIYGRGVQDDKGAAIMSLFALKAIKESGVELNRRIRLIFGCGEEIGADDMSYYVKNGGEIPVYGITPDGEYPLINGEKGLVTEYYHAAYDAAIREIFGGNAANIVPDYAYALLDNNEKIEATGKSSHGANPENGVNAIGALLIKLNELELKGKEKEAIAFLSEKIGMEYDGSGFDIKMEDEVSGPLTFNLGQIRGDKDGLTVAVNYRYPVTKNFEDCVPQVRKCFEEAGFELTKADVMDKLYVSADTALVKKLVGIYNEYTGQSLQAKSIGGGTYAKCLPNTLAYGIIFPDDEVTEHERDERIRIDHLMDAANITASAIYSMCNEL